MTSGPSVTSPLTSGDFAALEPARRLISHAYARRYAALHLGVIAGDYGLSWRSDGIEPVVALDPSGDLVWVAVDQQVACVSRKSGEPRLRLTLNSNALDIQFAGPCTAVLTETEALVFNPTLSLREAIGLQDLPEHVTYDGHTLRIHLSGGAVRTVDLSTSSRRASLESPS